MKWCSLTVVLFLVVISAQGYPNGAPRNRKTCKTLKPHHHGAHPQTSSPPYAVTAAKSKVPIGGSVNVTLTANSGNFYKGFIMQARPRMIGNVGYIHPIGSFKILDKTRSKTLDCLSGSENTVTHSSPEQKTSMSFIWTPPAKYKGSVYFRASFVKDYSTYWVNVSTKVVVGDTDTVDPVWLVGDSAEADGSSSESESSDEELLDLHPGLYQECGSTKSCFGLPESCVSAGSCDVIASVAAKDSKFEFELMGINVKYVSIILSENGLVDPNSMTTCAFINNRVKLLQHSYNEYHEDGSQLYKNDETLINSSYVDGVLYCKFLKEEILELNSVYFDLRNNQYFLILAAGNVKNEKEIINFDKMQFHVSERKNYLTDVSGFSESTTSNFLPNTNYWFQVKLKNWFFGVFEYFLMLR